MPRLAFALLIACASPKTPTVPAATTTCSDLVCLESNEGKVIDLEGTFVFPPDPKRKGKHLYRLVLGDGTSVVLHAKHAKLTKDTDGRRIAVRGVHYKHPTPERYGIFEAVSDPYLVEIFEVMVR